MRICKVIVQDMSKVLIAPLIQHDLDSDLARIVVAVPSIPFGQELLQQIRREPNFSASSFRKT